MITTNPHEEGFAVLAENRESRPEPISEVLPRLRRGHGLTQCELAARLLDASGNPSITREEVSRWERGKRIPGPYWRSWLCLVLDAPQHELERAAAFGRRLRRMRREASSPFNRNTPR
ncbi:helix-turn-helix transcriptional regulator [Saccharothrix syringae]|uniref:XRE family transcriptional regulator n=1 Tax=Saccharothrix syringae TaxID=103733 RepID=A0A5Q0H3E8_SACSY|nr:helix-turn-helix transcriptional regulator [Saccharothrix syringae]QFZ20242.1 XRE family transcriptional regulator [Saccharothrix syringae]